MNRKTFFKRLFMGIGTVLIAPKIISQTDSNKLNQNLPPACLFDGHTEKWYSSKYIIHDSQGNMIWKDLSGNGNHAKAMNCNISGEVIVRNCIDTEENQQSIYCYLKNQ